MMFLLGVLSVLQLILIPGFILIRWLPGKRSAIQQSAYIFMLSLLVNYAAVFALVAVGMYTRLVVLGLFAVEVAYLAWLERDRLRSFEGGWVSKTKRWVSKSARAFNDWAQKDALSASLYLIGSALAVGAIVVVLWIWISNFGTVFQNWDAWASWDRWAVKWAENRFPGDTWEYPQLIPTSYSLAYKFIGTTAVKFFGKSIMPLFTLAIVAMLFDLGRKYRSYGYMFGAAFAFYTIDLFLGQYIPDGYVDIPVACFSLMAIYTLLHARDIRKVDELKNALLLGSLATAAAAVTKQTGLFVMAVYPMFAYLWVLRARKDFSFGKALRLLAGHFLVATVVVAPWYIFMQYRIMYGGNVSNIDYVTNTIYAGQSLQERFLAAVSSLNHYVWAFVFVIVSLLVLSNEFRQLMILVILPFSILWALFLSYEHRNLAVPLPMLAMTAGVALEAWVSRIRAAWKTRRVPVAAMVVIGLLAVAVAVVGFSDENLTARQLSEQRLIFQPTLNQQLYRYFSAHDGPEPVITNYPIGWLPGLEETWVADSFLSFDGFQATLERYPEVTLLLVPMSAAPEILEAVQADIASGLYKLEFTEAEHMLVRIPPR